MEKKKGKRVLKIYSKIALVFIQQAALVTAVVLLCSFFINSYILVNMGNYRATYFVDPLSEETDFENADVFNDMFRNSIGDIVRLAVIQSQLETNGVFDGRKIVDVVSYANRKNADGALIEEPAELSAKYYLEDLLKWDKYGLEYVAQPVTILNYNNTIYLDDIAIDTASDVTDIDDIDISKTEEVEEATEEVTIEIAEDEITEKNATTYMTVDKEDDFLNAPIDYYTPYANFYDIYENPDGTVTGTVEMLKSRYQTINSQNLEKEATNWEDYFLLLHDLDLAVTNLAINYSDYQYYEEIYGTDVTNLKYCLCMNVDGKQTYISNIDEISSNTDITNDEVEKIFNSFEKNIYYYPGNMTYKTNTYIGESEVFDALHGYDYAYSDTSKVWIGVDTSYPIVTDRFAQTKEYFENNSPYPVQMLCVAGVCFILYFILLIYLSCYAGRKKDEETEEVSISLNGMDRLPTEFVVALALGTSVIGIRFFFFFFDNFSSQADKIWIPIFAGIYTFLSSAIFLTFFYSLIRRVKGHNLLSGSWIAKMVGFFAKIWKKVVESETPNPVVRIWIPYLGYLLFNFIFVTGGFIQLYSGSWFFAFVLILAAFIADMVIGFYRMRDDAERFDIIGSINKIRGGDVDYQVDEENMHGENVILAEAVNNIGEGIRNAVETSMKDERLKADLITNVSHDIKTPLTSIINYVDLLKREHIEDEKIQGYIQVLDSKSQRLKQLTEDLVEASKISSGNISYIFEKINLIELINQAIGEFSEKFESRGLVVVDNLANKTAVIEADSRRMWRVVENLFSNIYKYAMPNTRIYLALDEEDDKVTLSVKNISAQPLNINANELTERFIRGDISRSTEGSGLGLSIAKSLTEAQNGKFEIYLDGDLFKVILTFQLIE